MAVRKQLEPPGMGNPNRDGAGTGANGMHGSANGHGNGGGEARHTSSLNANSEYISERELENLKQQFQLLDADGSGSLDHAEFIQLGRKAGLPLEKLETLILLVDKNQVRGTGISRTRNPRPIGSFPLPVPRKRGWC